jgi:hypothetical protein
MITRREMGQLPLSHSTWPGFDLSSFQRLIVNKPNGPNETRPTPLDLTSGWREIDDHERLELSFFLEQKAFIHPPPVTRLVRQQTAFSTSIQNPLQNKLPQSTSTTDTTQSNPKNNKPPVHRNYLSHTQFSFSTPI